MTAQHVPHTPLWRKVLSLPHTRLGWWALGLAGPALVITSFYWLSDVFDLGDGEITGVFEALLVLAWLLTAVAGGVVAFIAELRDRSLLLLIAQVPGLIISAFIVWDPSLHTGRGRDRWAGFDPPRRLALGHLEPHKHLRAREERRANFLERRQREVRRTRLPRRRSWPAGSRLGLRVWPLPIGRRPRPTPGVL